MLATRASSKGTSSFRKVGTHRFRLRGPVPVWASRLLRQWCCDVRRCCQADHCLPCGRWLHVVQQVLRESPSPAFKASWSVVKQCARSKICLTVIYTKMTLGGSVDGRPTAVGARSQPTGRSSSLGNKGQQPQWSTLRPAYNHIIYMRHPSPRR